MPKADYAHTTSRRAAAGDRRRRGRTARRPAPGVARRVAGPDRVAGHHPHRRSRPRAVLAVPPHARAGGTDRRHFGPHADGGAAQLRVADHWLGGSAYAGEDVDAAIGNALATVERLAGGVPVPGAPAVAAAPPGTAAALLPRGAPMAGADDRSHRRWCELEDEGEIGSRDEPVIRAAVAEIHACI